MSLTLLCALAQHEQPDDGKRLSGTNPALSKLPKTFLYLVASLLNVDKKLNILPLLYV